MSVTSFKLCVHFIRYNNIILRKFTFDIFQKKIHKYSKHMPIEVYIYFHLPLKLSLERLGIFLFICRTFGQNFCTSSQILSSYILLSDILYIPVLFMCTDVYYLFVTLSYVSLFHMLISHPTMWEDILYTYNSVG